MNNQSREKQWLLEEKYKGIESPRFFEDLQKLESGVPLAYIIGFVPFLGCHIDLSSKPLIPRPETEFWVDYVLKKYVLEDQSSSILDIFSGSGCVGVAVLKHRPNTTTDFAELKSPHCEQIQKNLDLNGIEKNRYRIFQSDMFGHIPENHYDLILANPPYISNKRKNTVEDSVLKHEDPDALFADEDGLFFIKKLIQNSPLYLKPLGKLVIEFDPWQRDLLEDFLKQEHISNYEFLNDQYGKTRILVLENKKQNYI